MEGCKTNYSSHRRRNSNTSNDSKSIHIDHKTTDNSPRSPDVSDTISIKHRSTCNTTLMNQNNDSDNDSDSSNHKDDTDHAQELPEKRHHESSSSSSYGGGSTSSYYFVLLRILNEKVGGSAAVLVVLVSNATTTTCHRFTGTHI